MGTARHRNVEFPRQIRIGRIVQNLLGDGPHQRLGLHGLIGADPGHRTGHDVPDRIHARLERGQPDFFQLGKDRRHVVDPEVTELNLLSRREIQQSVAVGCRRLRQRTELERGGAPARNPHPQHEKPGSRIPQKEAVPLQTLDVGLGNGFPPMLGIVGDHLPHRQPIAFKFEGLNLVHFILP